MAKAKQQKRRKHKGGTQAGTVRPRGRRSARPRSRADARATAEQRRQEKLNSPPTWRTAIQRGAIAAVALFALLVIVFKTKRRGGAAALAPGRAPLRAGLPHDRPCALPESAMRRRERERERQAAE